MRQIPLGRGLFALVDDEDNPWLTQWRWHARKRTNRPGYDAVRVYRHGIGKKRITVTVVMHRLIAGAVDSKQHVDHINHDTLDNQRANLRLCSAAENHWNTMIHRDNRSGYKGISLHVDQPRLKPWRAWVQINGKRTCVGHFATPGEAARAYDAAAIEHYGQFALTNKSLGFLD